MDNIQLILYIVFIVIAILSRVLKAKDKSAPPKTNKNRPAQQGEAPEKTLTFEELLREFTGETEQSPAPVDEPYLDRRQETSTQSQPSWDDEEARRVYEEATRDSALKTIDEMVELGDNRPTTRLFVEVEEEEAGAADEFQKLLKDPEDIRKAIILKEILDRKY